VLLGCSMSVKVCVCEKSGQEIWRPSHDYSVSVDGTFGTPFKPVHISSSAASLLIK
jgi:hypothetical protein